MKCLVNISIARNELTLPFRRVFYFGRKMINMAKQTKKEIKLKRCNGCPEERTINEFYNTSDTDFFSDGKVPLCKTCCEKLLEEKGFNGFLSLMRIINKPVLENVYKGDMKDYIRMMNSMPQYKSKTFIESTLFEAERAEVKLEMYASDISEEELAELTHMFGEGYDVKDYVYLKYEFEDYCNKYTVDSKTLEMLIREIVTTQLEIRKARASKNSTKDLQKTLQDLLGSANLKPVQETGANAVDQESFGTLIKKWETEHPIPEPAAEWKDVDGIGKYIRTFFLGHLAKLFNKHDENEFNEEYIEEMEKYTVKPPGEDE